MKKNMPLEGLRWSRDSGSALYDTPQTAVLGRVGGDTLGIYIIHTVLNRYLVQGNLGVYVHTDYLLMDYLICFIYSIFLTYMCVWIVDLIRKNKILRTYLLGEK